LNPKEEAKDLYQRAKIFVESIIVTVILLLQLITQVGILFFTVWITVFTKGKTIADTTTDRYKIPNKIQVPITLS
jgi:hypothetical protein